MRRLFSALSALFLIVVAGSCLAADVTMQSGVNYDWWDDTAGNRGYQTYIPLVATVQHKEFSARLLAGYASTTRTVANVGRVSMDTFLDTKLNLSYEIVGKLPVDILLGLDFNLPTGKTKLSAKQLTLIMDPDLVTITNFGEGFDVNPVITVAKQWGPWSAGVGVGYAWRGEYDYSEGVSDFMPGDIFNSSAEVRYEISPGWTGRLYANYAWYGKQKIDDRNIFQQGELFLVGLGLHHAQDKWSADIDVKGIFRGKDEVLDPAGTLVTAPHQSFGDELVVTLFSSYAVSDKTSVQGLLQYLYLSENDFPSSSPFFSGDRNKFSVGAGLKHQFNTYLEGLISAKGFLMHDGPKAAEMVFSPVTERSYRGFTITAYLTGKF